MKKILLFSVFVFHINLVNAQPDTLFHENFEAGGSTFTLNTPDLSGSSAAAGYNQWVINSFYAGGSGQLTCIGIPTTFSVPPTSFQPAGMTGGVATQYMHISSDAAEAAGIFCCSYLAANGLCGNDEYYFASMNSDINTVGYDSVSFNFLWLCAGGDNIYGELYYSTDSGINWTLITIPTPQFKNQSTWVMRSVSMPMFAGQANLKFGYRFVNEVSFSAQDPGFAIDEVSITATMASAPPVAAFSVSDSSVCEGECVDFTDLSTGSPASWFWIFQGSSTSFSTQQNPSQICYPTSGSYPVTLIATGPGGSDTLTTTAVVIVNSLPSQPVITISGDTLFAPPGYSYQWYLDSVLIPGAVSDTFITVTGGNYSVVIIDMNGCTNVSAPVPMTTGINEFDSPYIEIFPNPSNGLFTISGIPTDTESIVTDAAGRIVWIGKIKETMDLKHLVRGTYILSVRYQEKEFRIRFVIL
jgi:PKD repeat protein